MLGWRWVAIFIVAIATAVVAYQGLHVRLVETVAAAGWVGTVAVAAAGEGVTTTAAGASLNKAVPVSSFDSSSWFSIGSPFFTRNNIEVGEVAKAAKEDADSMLSPEGEEAAAAAALPEERIRAFVESVWAWAKVSTR